MMSSQASSSIQNKGIFADEEAALTNVVDRLVAALDPASIWLFGSRARGNARPDSDIDLLLVAKAGGAFGSNDYEMVVEPLRGLGVGCDIVPCSQADFREASNIKTSLVAQVLLNGRRLYDAEAG